MVSRAKPPPPKKKTNPKHTHTHTNRRTNLVCKKDTSRLQRMDMALFNQCQDARRMDLSPTNKKT